VHLHLLSKQLLIPTKCLKVHSCPTFCLAFPFWALPDFPSPMMGNPSFLPPSAFLLSLDPPSFLCLPAGPAWTPACLALQPLLGRVWSWAAELPGATVKDWNVGRAGCGLGEWGAVGGGEGFSLGWSEFSHLARVQATRPCQADDITLQECPLLLLAPEALYGGAPSSLNSPTVFPHLFHHPFSTAFPF
jgi:hypothetical protein